MFRQNSRQKSSLRWLFRCGRAKLQTNMPNNHPQLLSHVLFFRIYLAVASPLVVHASCSCMNVVVGRLKKTSLTSQAMCAIWSIIDPLVAPPPSPPHRLLSSGLARGRTLIGCDLVDADLDDVSACFDASPRSAITYV